MMQCCGTDDWGTSTSRIFHLSCKFGRAIVLRSVYICVHEISAPKKTDSRASAVGQRVFSDIQGPFEVSSMHGARYALSFIDNFSWLAEVKHLVKKSDALLKFQEFVAENGAPKCLRIDNIRQVHLEDFVENSW